MVQLGPHRGRTSWYESGSLGLSLLAGLVRCSSVHDVDLPRDRAPDPETFTRTVAHVQSYVRSEPGAYSALMSAADADPAGTTTSLVALGAVLLDIAAGAFSLSPDEMLEKVSAGIAEHADVSS